MYKVNWDAAFDVEKWKIGVGVLIRNHAGQFVGALRVARPLTQNSFIAESLALLMAMKLCQDLKIQHFILEGDALQVVNLMMERNGD